MAVPDFEAVRSPECACQCECVYGCVYECVYGIQTEYMNLCIRHEDKHTICCFSDYK